jgi:FixJ family two-component response regulator
MLTNLPRLLSQQLEVEQMSTVDLTLSSRIVELREARTQEAFMTNQKRLTAGEFDAIRPHLGNLETKNVEAARRVLVDGALQKDIAAELGLTKEAMSAIVKRAWTQHVERGARPAGWERVEMVLPPDLVEVAKTLGDVARKRVEK